MNLQRAREKIELAASNADIKAGRKMLVELSKEILAHIGGFESGYEIVDVRNGTRLGHFIEMMNQGRRLSEANIAELVDSIAKSYFQMERAAERNANNVELQAKIAAERAELAGKAEVITPAPKTEFEVNGQVVKLEKWEKYGKKRIYLKNKSVANKKLADCGYVDGNGWNEEGGIDSLRFMRRFTNEWQAVIDAATEMLK